MSSTSQEAVADEPITCSSQERQQLIDLSSPPFPFRKLPLEIRKQIYGVCLLDRVDVHIVLEERFATFADNHHETERLVRLDRGYSLNGAYKCAAKTPHSSFNINILLASSAIYQEAAPVLYGINVFRFNCYCQWLPFHKFGQHLSSMSMDSVRKLVINFPLMNRYSMGPSRFSESGACGVRVLHLFPKLRTVCFDLGVGVGLMSRDMNCLRQCYESIGQSKFVLNLIRPRQLEDKFYENSVRICSVVLGQLQKWGWQIVGEFTTVSGEHRFHDEKVLATWLEADRWRSRMIKSERWSCMDSAGWKLPDNFGEDRECLTPDQS